MLTEPQASSPTPMSDLTNKLKSPLLHSKIWWSTRVWSDGYFNWKGGTNVDWDGQQGHIDEMVRCPQSFVHILLIQYTWENSSLEAIGTRFSVHHNKTMSFFVSLNKFCLWVICDKWIFIVMNIYCSHSILCFVIWSTYSWLDSLWLLYSITSCIIYCIGYIMLVLRQVNFYVVLHTRNEYCLNKINSIFILFHVSKCILLWTYISYSNVNISGLLKILNKFKLVHPIHKLFTCATKFYKSLKIYVVKLFHPIRTVQINP